MVWILHGNSNQINQRESVQESVCITKTISYSELIFDEFLFYDHLKGSFWYSTKKTLGLAGKPLDDNAEIHKNGFKNLVRAVKDAIRPDNYILSVTVLPNVNTTLFYDVQSIVPHVDFITLAAYDYQTWDRNPYEADYPAPIYPLHERIPESNIDFQVHLWLSSGAPANKLIVAIPTHGRSWQLTMDSTKTGVPPIQEVSFIEKLIDEYKH